MLGPYELVNVTLEPTGCSTLKSLTFCWSDCELFIEKKVIKVLIHPTPVVSFDTRLIDDRLDIGPGPRAGELRRETGPESVHATLRACHHSWLIVCIDEVENGHHAVRRIP